jgi:hypothetical protein
LASLGWCWSNRRVETSNAAARLCVALPLLLLICKLTEINVGFSFARDKSVVNHSTEGIMTTGSLLYLLMSIAMFAAFSAVLAYQSWQQSRFLAKTTDPKTLHHTATA